MRETCLPDGYCQGLKAVVSNKGTFILVVFASPSLSATEAISTPPEVPSLGQLGQSGPLETGQPDAGVLLGCGGEGSGTVSPCGASSPHT